MDSDKVAGSTRPFGWRFLRGLGLGRVLAGWADRAVRSALRSDGGTSGGADADERAARLARWADPNGRSSSRRDLLGRTLVEEALDARGTETLRALLELGADPNAPCDDGSSPLSAAALRNWPEGAGLLLGFGADPNGDGGRGGEPPLSNAVLGFASALASGNPVHGTRSCPNRAAPEILLSLLSAGADPNVPGRDGRAALAQAACCGLDGCLRLLLDSGAVADARDDRGRTALMDAASVGSSEACSLLLATGADGSAKDLSGAGALARAAAGGHAAALRELLSAGVPVDGRDRRGTTALMESASSGKAGAVGLLLSAGADASLRDWTGRSSLDMVPEGALLLEADKIRTLLMESLIHRAGRPPAGAEVLKVSSPSGRARL